MTDLIKLAEERGGQYSESAEVIVITADDLQQFAQRYRAMVLLEAAKVCEEVANEWRRFDGNVMGSFIGARGCQLRLEKLAEVQNG